MINIINLIRRKLFTENNKVMYGRWNLDYDKYVQDRKVYLTNMDHCGCCEIKSGKNGKSGNIIKSNKCEQSELSDSEIKL
jgi:hypothetical protein